VERDRRERARQAVVDGVRRTRKWTEGWQNHYASYFEVSKRALEGGYTPAELVADAVALWTNASSMLWGFGMDLDEGLDFEVDEVAEAVGPRYIPVPKWMVGPPEPYSVELARATGHAGNDLTKNNVVVRVEGQRLTVALVGLRQPVTEGDYRMKFGAEEIPFSVKLTV
jgi:hypothetical protein